MCCDCEKQEMTANISCCKQTAAEVTMGLDFKETAKRDLMYKACVTAGLTVAATAA